jgi:hypothetical protein
MSLFKRERATQIVAASGTVRVTVEPRPAWIALIVEVIGISLLGGYIVHTWGSGPLWFHGLLIWAMATAVVAWFYQLSGSEIIEFDSQKISICKQVLGWTRVSEHPLSSCRELRWRRGEAEGDTEGLQCKVGWRTIRFGAYVSEEEANEIFATLQTNLPKAFEQLCPRADWDRNHFTTLNLTS